MELQIHEVGTPKKITPTRGPGGECAIVTPPKEESFEDTQNPSASDEKSRIDMMQLWVIIVCLLSCFPIIIGTILFGFYYGTMKDGVNNVGVPYKKTTRFLQQIGFWCLFPGIICMVISIPTALCRMHLYDRRLKKRNKYRGVPRNEDSVPS